MTKPLTIALAVLAALVCFGRPLTSLAADLPGDASDSTPTEPFVLGPPPGARPVVVKARFDLQDINDINDGAETFEFSGVLSLTWRDPRQAFDPAVAGVKEKIFQGTFQFDEISPGWYPQVVLVNQSGLYEMSGVMLRVQPDGTATLVETVNATAESEFDMRRFPLDEHRLEAIFEVLGFDRDEVELQLQSGRSIESAAKVRLPQWTIDQVGLYVRDRSAPYAGHDGTSSALIVSVDVRREAFYTTRLVLAPLILIVLLSFSVFWMEQSSLGDRLSVSFIGILTAVAYQLVMAEQLPRISYVTLMHALLSFSFLTMCATVVVNLVVANLDKRGKGALGDRLDRRCRWAFPLAYFALLLFAYAVAMLFF